MTNTQRTYSVCYCVNVAKDLLLSQGVMNKKKRHVCGCLRADSSFSYIFSEVLIGLTMNVAVGVAEL